MWKYYFSGLVGSLGFFLGFIFFELAFYDTLSATSEFYLFQCLVPCILGGILAGYLVKPMAV